MTLAPLALMFALVVPSQDRGRQVAPAPRSKTGSLRGLGGFRLAVERQAAEGSSLISADDVRDLVAKRLASRKIDLADPEAPPERRKPVATLKFQLASVDVDGRAGYALVGKLLVPTVSPNDPNGPGTSALLWEMQRIWIGPEERMNQRMRENLDLVVDSFAEDYARENGR